MKLKDLKKLVDELMESDSKLGPYDDWTVVIPACKNFRALGPIPKVGIKGLTAGFDWQNGMIIIHPDGELQQKESEDGN